MADADDIREEDAAEEVDADLLIAAIRALVDGTMDVEWETDVPDDLVEQLRERLNEDEDEIEDEDGDALSCPRAQWSKNGGSYSMVGNTVPKLPPGYYDLGSANGTLFFISIDKRDDKILRFPDAAVDDVVTEIEKFWTREKLFKEFGLPYKRGILLYGPPGSGKTCTLQLIARDVVGRGGIVILFDVYLFLTAYRQVRTVQPDTPIVCLMEDLDALLEGRAESTVLNLLDGTEALHKVVFVATTNYPEKLGERIVNRPSRFDKRIKVAHPNDAGRRMYIASLLENHGDVKIDVDRYVQDTRGLSLAHVKELFVATVLIGTPYDEALRTLKAMDKEMVTSRDDKREVEETHTGMGGWL